jgi:hypothetical protein
MARIGADKEVFHPRYPRNPRFQIFSEKEETGR